MRTLWPRVTQRPHHRGLRLAAWQAHVQEAEQVQDRDRDRAAVQVEDAAGLVPVVVVAVADRCLTGLIS